VEKNGSPANAKRWKAGCSSGSGKLKDRVPNPAGDTHDRLEREKRKRELRREQESKSAR
jgi:hypothetical protein